MLSLSLYTLIFLTGLGTTISGDTCDTIGDIGLALIFMGGGLGLSFLDGGDGSLR
jgi:hypothetical protein